jgi:hypothetical protein
MSKEEEEKLIIDSSSDLRSTHDIVYDPENK